jgi:hypothetical protein
MNKCSDSAGPGSISDLVIFLVEIFLYVLVSSKINSETVRGK